MNFEILYLILIGDWKSGAKLLIFIFCENRWLEEWCKIFSYWIYNELRYGNI